jgi:hypothetical protein
LAAGLVALDHERFQIGACRVKGGGVSGAAGTDDDDVAGFAHDEIAVRLPDSDFDALRCWDCQETKSYPRKILIIKSSSPKIQFTV